MTALVAGGAAVALSPWMRHVAGKRSGWLTSGVHVVLAGVGGASAAVLAHGWAELVAYALLALACALLVAIDLAVFRLPDIIVGPMYPILLVAFTVAAAVEGDWGRLGRSVASAAILIVCYFVLAFIAPSGLGLGDVKFSGLLGLFLGWLGWSYMLAGFLAAFVLSAALALVLLLARRATMRTAYPFGPLMVVGAVLGAVWGPLVFPGL